MMKRMFGRSAAGACDATAERMIARIGRIMRAMLAAVGPILTLEEVARIQVPAAGLTDIRS
jgi:hypothetical protein